MNRSLGLMQRCWVVWTTMALGGLATFGTEQPTNGSFSTPSDTGARPLSRAAAQRAALEKNWDLLAAAAEVEIATAQKIVAHEFPNPTLALSSSKISVDHHPSSTVQGNDV